MSRDLLTILGQKSKKMRIVFSTQLKTAILGVANGTFKIMGLAKFSFDLEISAAFAKSLGVSF